MKGKKRRCTDKLVERVRTATSECHVDAKEQTLKSQLLDIEATTTEYYSTGFVRSMKEKVDNLYLENIKKLSSKMLEDILFLHEKGKLRRADRTVETILSELTRRALLNDYSDLIND